MSDEADYDPFVWGVDERPWAFNPLLRRDWRDLMQLLVSDTEFRLGAPKFDKVIKSCVAELLTREETKSMSISVFQWNVFKMAHMAINNETKEPSKMPESIFTGKSCQDPFNFEAFYAFDLKALDIDTLMDQIWRNGKMSKYNKHMRLLPTGQLVDPTDMTQEQKEELGMRNRMMFTTPSVYKTINMDDPRFRKSNQQDPKFKDPVQKGRAEKRRARKQQVRQSKSGAGTTMKKIDDNDEGSSKTKKVKNGPPAANHGQGHSSLATMGAPIERSDATKKKSASKHELPMVNNYLRGINQDEVEAGTDAFAVAQQAMRAAQRAGRRERKLASRRLAEEVSKPNAVDDLNQAGPVDGVALDTTEHEQERHEGDLRIYERTKARWKEKPTPGFQNPKSKKRKAAEMEDLAEDLAVKLSKLG